MSGPSPLWYLTRGTGLVTIILLTATVALGVLTTARWHRPGWPRFATAGLHRNVSLLVVVLLAIHILTAELDTFAPVGWLSVVVPFASRYRPVWLGLGTLAFDLLLAVAITSLIRTRLPYRTWKAVHWLAYLSWPVALVHGLGTGTDARLGLVQFIDVVCVGTVLAAVAVRLLRGWPGRLGVRLGGLALTAAVAVALVAWASTGPLRPGWAKRAGTPTKLLVTSSGTAVAPSSRAASGPAGQSTRGVPSAPFRGALTGTIGQTGPDQSGQVTVTIDTRVSGGFAGSLIITLHGQQAGEGVSLASSSVSFGPITAPAEYHGDVIALNGDQLVAYVHSPVAPAMDLGVGLQINPASRTVTGTVQAQQAVNAPAHTSERDPEGGP